MSSHTHNPVLLVFPPEIDIPKLGETAKPYVPSNALSKVLASKLKIFGTMQILFGLMNFSFGMILLFTCVDPYPRFPLIFISGYPFWSPVLFITSGALLIAMKRKTTKTLIRVSQAINALSALGAVIGTVLLAFGLVLDQHYLCGFSNQHSQCHAITTLLIGIFIMLIVFTITEFFIALSFSLFGGKFACVDDGK